MTGSTVEIANNAVWIMIATWVQGIYTGYVTAQIQTLTRMDESLGQALAPQSKYSKAFYKELYARGESLFRDVDAACDGKKGRNLTGAISDVANNNLKAALLRLASADEQ